MNNNHVVIMAGGIGSRFWPMSTPEYPKQFIDVMGCGKSLIQMTVERFLPVCPVTNFWVVTSEKYVDIVRRQLPEIPESHILAEPEARNTAPCIAYASWKIGMKYPDANIVVTPSDALVVNTTEFARVMNQALAFTAAKDAIVTVGIRPSRPETGYGYISAGNPATADGEICKVEAFKEKPDYVTACKYLKDGHSEIMDEMAKDFYGDKETETVKRLFPTCEKISIDYAVMEKAEEIYTLPAEFGWSDLGSWRSLRTLLPQDADGNACVGNDVRLYDSRNCVVHVPEERKVVLEGLDGYIVAEKNGALLVCRLKNEQMIKEFAK